jgi:hypothetical protein
MSGGASTSDVVSDAISSNSDVSTTLSVVLAVELSIVGVTVEAEAHAPNNSATRTTIDMIVSVFFIFFSSAYEFLG